MLLKLFELICFARAPFHVGYFYCRNKALTASCKLLRYACRYLMIRKAFSKFYRRYNGLVEKNIKCKLQQGTYAKEVHILGRTRNIACKFSQNPV